MIIYELRIQHSDFGTCISWHPTSAKAAEEVEDLIAEDPDYYEPEVTRHDIGKSKRALIHFLNHRTPNRDNG